LLLLWAARQVEAQRGAPGAHVRPPWRPSPRRAATCFPGRWWARHGRILIFGRRRSHPWWCSVSLKEWKRGIALDTQLNVALRAVYSRTEVQASSRTTCGFAFLSRTHSRFIR
jgi:hypothetical protein